MMLEGKLTFGCVVCLIFFFLGEGLLADTSKTDHSDISLHCQYFPSDCLPEQEDEGKSSQYEQMTEGFSRPVLLEQAQSIFGSISEISKVIERENIDWDRVNIDVLWEHLKDMNALMINTNVKKRKLSNGLLMNVTGDENATRAMDEMIPAHSKFLRDVRPEWDITFKKVERGYSIRVTSDNSYESSKIKALGFSGFMVQDDHHAAHHFSIALGKNVHIH